LTAEPTSHDEAERKDRLLDQDHDTLAETIRKKDREAKKDEVKGKDLDGDLSVRDALRRVKRCLIVTAGGGAVLLTVSLFGALLSLLWYYISDVLEQPEGPKEVLDDILKFILTVGLTLAAERLLRRRRK